MCMIIQPPGIIKNNMFITGFGGLQYFQNGTTTGLSELHRLPRLDSTLWLAPNRSRQRTCGCWLFWRFSEAHQGSRSTHLKVVVAKTVSDQNPEMQPAMAAHAHSECTTHHVAAVSAFSSEYVYVT